MPTGDVSTISSLTGNWARRPSSAMEVVVKLSAIFSAGKSRERGTVEDVKRPTSADAVEETSKTSVRFGGKFLSLDMK